MPNYSEGDYFEKLTKFRPKLLQIIIKIKKLFQNSFKSCKISTFNFCFLGSVILYWFLDFCIG